MIQLLINLGSIKHCTIIFINTNNTISLIPSIFCVISQNNVFDAGFSDPETILPILLIYVKNRKKKLFSTHSLPRFPQVHQNTQIEWAF